jgi:hypothetical protein
LRIVVNKRLKNKKIGMPNFFIIIAVVQFAICSLPAQSVCYTYDASGNRTQRVPCVLALQSHTSKYEPKAIVPQEGLLLLFPNPNRGIFTVSVKDYPIEAQVSIYDQMGRLVLQRNLNDGQFNLSNEASGWYVLTVTHPTIRSSTVKFELLTD